MQMVDSKYSVSWDDYQKSICNGLSGLQQRGEFVDMTLAADGHRVMAHKMVLSLVSPYIRDLINSAVCPHPVIFLSKVSHQTLQSILEYAYTGEVVVSNERIQEFLYACRELRIRGLEEMNNIESDDTAKNPTLSDLTTLQVNRYAEEKPQQLKEDSSIRSSRSSDNDAYEDNDVYNDDTCSAIKTPVSKPTMAIADTTLKYTVSNQGRAQVVLNRYIYYHRNTRKNGVILWKCFNYTLPGKNKQRCPAFLVIRDSKVLQRACAHNHGFHDKLILSRIRKRNMFTTLKEAQQVIEKREESKIDTETALTQVLTAKSISRPQSEQELPNVP